MTNVIFKIAKGTAILAINPNAKYNIYNDDLDNMEWLDGTTPISKADIEAKVTEMTEAEEARIAQLAIDKASAKTKLMAGEALTEAEADAIVL